MGKKVGAINLIDTSLKAFVKRGLDNREDVAQDPFFGPGVNYLLKDSQGDFFVVFFEYRKGHTRFNGSRLAINNASVVVDNKKVFLGSPYEGGRPNDKAVLKQLKELTERQAESQPATQPADEAIQKVQPPPPTSKDGPR